MNDWSLAQLDRDSLDAREMAAWLGRTSPEWFREYLRPTPEARAAYLGGRFASIAAAAHGQVWAVRRGGALAALLGYERLAWDCAHFGFECARLDVFALSRDLDAGARAAAMRLGLAQAVALARAGRVRLLSRRLLAERLNEIRLLEGLGFTLADSVLTLRRAVEGAAPESGSCRPPRPEDLPALRAMIGDAFPHSRFLTDPIFDRDKGRSLYVSWLDNLFAAALENTPGMRLLVAEEPSGPAGFVALSLPEQEGEPAEILLVAVAEGQRGRGIGGRLMGGALRACRQEAVDQLETTTWVCAQGPLAFYQKEGFTVVENMLSFHLDLGKAPRPDAKAAP